MKFVPQSVTRMVGREVLKAKKNSPHIFFVGGVIGVVSSTVLACKATLKLEETIDDITQEVKMVKTRSPLPTQTTGEYYKDVGYVYGKSAIKLGRLYGPSLAVGVVSISALTGSHIQLARRNTALTATLAAFIESYDRYRVRVQDEIGEERELEIYRATSEGEIEGEGKKKELAKFTDPNGLSPYARVFDETSPNWQKDAELNRIFIQCQQNYANHLLRARGHVFLNEVYDSLGFERSRAGQVVGWVLNGEGDNFVDFGMFESMNSRFINQLERSIWLDFNVDGVVFDKI